ncbi:MAG: acetolactate decarboxylase [Melioribacteraceae bacterium]|nr:acetolactate decarboxylase [Melioribacteraceae bacterium]
MKKIILLLLLTTFFVSCVNEVKQNREVDYSDDIYQYSSKNILLENDYVGDLTVGEIKRKGNFGLGTFNMFDGELVFYETNVYQAKTDGTINEMPNDKLSPYVVTKFFEADTTITFPNNISLDSLKAILLPIVENTNTPLAIKIDAKFKTLKSRSIDKVDNESIELTEIIANQTEFDFTNVKGTVIGFWYPQYFDGVNFPGFHFHVLLDDLSGGGHLLDCTFENLNIEIDFASGVIVDL